MKRRWFIRICFMLPVLLCLVAWVWFGTHYCVITYYHDGYEVTCSPSDGVVRVAYTSFLDYPDMTQWRWLYYSEERPSFWPQDTDFSHYYFGFRVTRGRYPHVYAVPYWFFILFFSSLLILVWRKTRPRVKPAFPIESGIQHA